MRVRGIALPAEEPIECWIDGDRLTFTPQPDAEAVPGHHRRPARPLTR